MGQTEKDCFAKAKTKGEGKSAGSLDESETSVPENTSVNMMSGSGTIVAEEGLHLCMNFRVAAFKVCRTGYRIILDSETVKVACFTNTNECIGLGEEKGVYVFRLGFLWQ